MSKFEPRAFEGIFVGYGTDSRTYRDYNNATRLDSETCNVKFDEHDGSKVGQVDLGDVGDEMPPQAIRRMGVGFYLPVEEDLVDEGEGQSSTQVMPSPTQDPQIGRAHV